MSPETFPLQNRHERALYCHGCGAGRFCRHATTGAVVCAFCRRVAPEGGVRAPSTPSISSDMVQDDLTEMLGSDWRRLSRPDLRIRAEGAVRRAMAVRDVAQLARVLAALADCHGADGRVG